MIGTRSCSSDTSIYNDFNNF
ncbi:hypothetical protein CY0110_17547 [Crocosphaera chwakensis CCY0110]|uniref:Uncharacterized protein n=1 Tax=Crocosphaera chwakensis CCY0110 TaxID=391612 RepID=A3IIJ1_9CHRO|nr:hypothetical protein CY0110_17547 [Crocosphaera chwakensis CCY0110]